MVIIMMGTSETTLSSHFRLTWFSLQGTSGYSSRSTWQKARVLAAPTVRKPVPGIRTFSPAPPVHRTVDGVDT